MGYETQPMHMHGYHGKVIGSDQRAWPWANASRENGVWPDAPTPWGKGMEKNTLTIGSGETYEWLVNFGLQAVVATYPAGHADAAMTRAYQPAGEQHATGSLPFQPIRVRVDPYIAGPTVTGAVGIPTPGQLFPFHNHDDYKATNNGTYPGGMFTALMPVP